METWKLGFVICVWFLLTVESCLCRFVVENINLKVTSPESFNNRKYECALADFGVPLYGGTLRGVVKYPKKNQKACNSFSDDTSFKMKDSGGIPVFVLVDRGDCYFTHKAWNAQNAGAAAILVADDQDRLLTIDLPKDDPNGIYLHNLTITSLLITHSLGASIKKAQEDNDRVLVTLDWTEALPHPDQRVEYEFWTNINDECGLKCDSQLNFIKTFKGVAQILEQKGHTKFTPHYITWYCPEEYVLSRECKSQCINHGRYCALGRDEDFSEGYSGKEIVVQNLIQACFYKVANEDGKSWLWWDYVTNFSAECRMKDQKYNKECAYIVITSLGVDIKKIDECVGDIEEDSENAVLKAEQDAQIGKGTRGDVTIQPTLVINNKQYRGSLDKKAVLKAICSGYKETTKPEVCLNNDVETNECPINVWKRDSLLHAGM